MESAVGNLMRLGLKEYEARIYIALVGLGEATVRRIHEVSGVPRPRVYDVLNELAAKGFVNIRQGTPLMYSAMRPDDVVEFLKKDLDTAARESVKALEELSFDAEKNYSPIWYVHSDWTIQQNLELLAGRVENELTVLCFDKETLKKFQGPITSAARDHRVRILFPEGEADGLFPLEGVMFYEAGTLRNFFGVNIFEKVFCAPIDREGTVFRLECICIADDRESMLVYTQDGNRMAVIITLPFITCVQSRLFAQMIGRAHPVGQDGGRDAVAGKRKRKQIHGT